MNWLDEGAEKQPSAWRRAYREALFRADVTGRVQIVYHYDGVPRAADEAPRGPPAFAVAPSPQFCARP